MAATAVTLNDLEGRLSVAGLFKCNSSNICAVFYTMSTDSELALFLCISRASCYFSSWYWLYTCCIQTFGKAVWPDNMTEESLIYSAFILHAIRRIPILIPKTIGQSDLLHGSKATAEKNAHEWAFSSWWASQPIGCLFNSVTCLQLLCTPSWSKLTAAICQANNCRVLEYQLPSPNCLNV